MDIIYITDFRNYKFATVEGCYSVAYSGPFGNCQNFVINNFRSLLSFNGGDLKHINNFLYNVSNTWERLYCVIDIEEEVYEELKEIVNSKKLNVEFIVESPYENANGTSMVLCILNLSELKPIE